MGFMLMSMAVELYWSMLARSSLCSGGQTSSATTGLLFGPITLAVLDALSHDVISHKMNKAGLGTAVHGLLSATVYVSVRDISCKYNH